MVPATQEAEVGELWSETCWGKSKRPYLKNKLKQKRARCVVQVVEYLPSKHYFKPTKETKK
jgi:hypothetical protein